MQISIGANEVIIAPFYSLALEPRSDLGYLCICRGTLARTPPTFWAPETDLAPGHFPKPTSEKKKRRKRKRKRKRKRRKRKRRSGEHHVLKCTYHVP